MGLHVRCIRIDGLEGRCGRLVDGDAFGDRLVVNAFEGAVDKAEHLLAAGDSLESDRFVHSQAEGLRDFPLHGRQLWVIDRPTHSHAREAEFPRELCDREAAREERGFRPETKFFLPVVRVWFTSAH